MKRRIEKLKTTFYETILSTLSKIDYFFNKKKIQEKEIWIISETENQAQDNGYYFFKYMRERFPEKNIYYVIGKNAPRIKDLKNLGNILYLGEYKTMLYLLGAKYILSTHGLWMLPSELGITKKITKKMLSGKKIKLGHGITAMKNGSAVYHKKRYLLNDFFVACSDFEKDIFINNYGYNQNEIITSGFPRYDDMENQIKEKIILLMPTWRDKQDNLGEQFLKTEFYLKVKSLLKNITLQEFLRKENIKLYLYLHENFQKYNEYFYEFENEEIYIVKNKEKNVKELLKMSTCLISDYSSIIFDFAYMDKPVISYQFDYEDYINSRDEKPFIDIALEIPALVTRDEEEIVNFIKKLEENKFKPLKSQKDCLKKFFKYTDNKNCERLYNSILEIK